LLHWIKIDLQRFQLRTVTATVRAELVEAWSAHFNKLSANGYAITIELWKCCSCYVNYYFLL